MNGQGKTSSEVGKRRSVFRGKSPWLKVGVFLAIIFFCLSFGLGWMRSDAGRTGENKVPISPMQFQAKVPIVPKIDLKGKKVVALTFDDGPSSATTPRLLDILKDKGVSVTFFALGTAARGNSEIVQREEKEGHEVATHSMYHNQLNKMSAGAIRADLGEARGVIKDIIGYEPRLMRPPYGAINQTVASAVQMPMILWTVDTLDWKDRNTESILRNTKEQVFDGAVILMHDIHSTTVDAVPVVIDALREDGYEFLTVTQLANLREVTMENGGNYGSFRP